MKQKRLFSLLLAAGLCVSLAACGGTDDTADDPVTEPDQEPTGYTAEELGQDDFTPATLAEVNGTWVDGAIVNGAPLHDGSSVQIGTFTLIYHESTPERIETGE